MPPLTVLEMFWGLVFYKDVAPNGAERYQEILEMQEFPGTLHWFP
jgi:hypothetical protein